jgi:hypothetical protein
MASLDELIVETLQKLEAAPEREAEIEEEFLEKANELLR